MENINEIRKKINNIDKDMAILFQKRMELVNLVIEHKRNNNLHIYDPKREEELIDINLKYINDENIKQYYLDFIKEIINISKKYQEDILNKKK